MDRTIQPYVHQDFDFKLMGFNRHEFENGCVLYNFPYDILPVAKVVFIFPAGRKYQQKPLIAGYTNKMLFEGTASKTQHQIAEGFEILGATVNADVQEDFASITVMSTEDNIADVLVMLQHILIDSVFPEEQLQTLTRNNKQDFLVNLKKVGFLARREFFRFLFTENHPYGRYANESDFDHLNKSELVSFFKTFYNLNKCQVVWTGNIKPQTFNLFTELFGSIQSDSELISEPDMSLLLPVPGRVNVELEGAKQSALFIGRIIPGLLHQDHEKIKFLNMVLGGYFGSRLMRNLREDKGYTYGIGSAIYNYKHASALVISTQVNAEFTEESVNEIKKEIHRLQNELIPNEELRIVKSYLTGGMMQMLDGPFAQSRYFSSVLIHELNAQDLLEKFSHSIRQMTSETIKQLAQEYLQPDQLYYAISGKIMEN